MTQSDFEVRIERALGSPAFVRAEQRALVIVPDASALRELVVGVEQLRRKIGMCEASHVEFDIACAVVEARIEALEDQVHDEGQSADLQALLTALTFAVQGSGPSADGEAMVHWAVGVGLGISEPN